MTYQIDSYHPDTCKVPRHVGIIADGTRRWAKQNGVSLEQAYLQAGVKSLEWAEYLYARNVSIVSIYVLSIFNFRRPNAEVEAILKSLCAPANVQRMIDLAGRHGTAISFIGERALLAPPYQAAIDQVETATRSYSKTRLNLLTAYNPVREVLSAVEQTGGQPERFLDHLWVKEPVDAIIRTSGANLYSDFLPLQSGFARFYVVDNLFNDCGVQDLDQMLSQFAQLDRLYGN